MGYGQPWDPHMAAYLGHGHGHPMSNPNGGDEISRFIRENQIDASAEAALRGLAQDLQRKVLDEGKLHGTKNPSAVLMSRIRNVREGGKGRRRSGSPSRNVHAPPGGPGRGLSRSRSRRRSR